MKYNIGKKSSLVHPEINTIRKCVKCNKTPLTEDAYLLCDNCFKHNNYCVVCNKKTPDLLCDKCYDIVSKVGEKTERHLAYLIEYEFIKELIRKNKIKNILKREELK